MGIKFFRLRLQTLPWCFHIAGNQIPCGHLHDEHESPPPTIKLIKSDGYVQSYDKPINASQLMSEFPKHLICRSDSFYIGQKIPALSESDKLELGQKYFLLPQHLFQNDLSFVSISRLIKPSSGSQPFDIQKTPNGSLRIIISEDFISRLVMRSEETDGGDEVLCTTPQLKKDYSQLVGPRQWKPKLETIRESSKEKRMKNKRKISYTSSFKFRTPKSPKTVSLSVNQGGPNSNFNKIVNQSAGPIIKKGLNSSPKVKIIKCSRLSKY